MTDYLTVAYNEKMRAIQETEAAALEDALVTLDNAMQEFHRTSRHITEEAAQARMEAGIADAAARAQRDHEYHHGRIVASGVVVVTAPTTKENSEPEIHDPELPEPFPPDDVTPYPEHREDA